MCLEKRLGLLKALNDAVVSAARISPDDLLITLYETPGDNISFGRGLANGRMSRTKRQRLRTPPKAEDSPPSPVSYQDLDASR